MVMAVKFYIVDLGKLERQVLKMTPLFYEKGFREKNRADNVDASLQQPEKDNAEHAD